MIDREKTLNLFGYYPEEITAGYKKVVHCCDSCGKQRNIEYRRVISKFPYYCHPCMMKIISRKHFPCGHEHPNYVDGKTLIKHFCKFEGCKQEINLSTVYEGGFCKKHSKLGERNGRYIDGRTPLRNLIRNSILGKQWALDVFKKDNFTCQKCGKKKEISGSLNPHHKKHFSVILSEFLNFYSQFSPIEDKEILVRLAESWPDFWDVNNGQTLCDCCHLEEHAANENTRQG
jgi:hypothetical protein